MRRGKFSPKIFPGARFGRLTVIERIPGNAKLGIRAKVRCLCDCGNESSPNADSLSGGLSKSCGCARQEKVVELARERSRKSKGYGQILPGAVFSRLTVIRRIERDGKLTNRVKCRCSCGKLTKSNIDGLVYGGVKSCGCLARENLIVRNKKSGRFGGFSGKYPRTFITWQSMMARCYNKNQRSYEKYGAVGVKICESLRSHPENLAKLIGFRKKKTLTIDRFPIYNGNYTCGQCKECKKNGWKLNVRWTTRKGQSENRGSFNTSITAFGYTKLVSQWSEISGVGEETLRKRVLAGWDSERVLTTPDTKGRCIDPSSLSGSS